MDPEEYSQTLWPEDIIRRMSQADFTKAAMMLRGDGSPIYGFGSLPEIRESDACVPEAERR